MKGVSWQLGNGKSVKFWKDNWAEGLAPLGTIATSEINQMKEDRSVATYVDENGCWKWNEF